MNDAFAAQPAPLSPSNSGAAATPVHKPARSMVLPGEIVGVFYGQLAGLLKSGMPLPNALRTLSNESGTAKFRAALERAAAAIDSGKSPEEAFSAEEQELGGILGRVTAASAASGELPTLLAELSAWALSQDRIVRKIVEALLYPFSVLVLACVLGMVFFTAAQAFNIYSEPNAWEDWASSRAARTNFSFRIFHRRPRKRSSAWCLPRAWRCPWLALSRASAKACGGGAKA